MKSDGSFAIYPLAAGQNYDILIRGRNVATTLITGVPVSAGSTPTSGATAISSGTIPLTLSTASYWANFNTALAPTAGAALFQQTLSGGKPYEVRWGSTNPFTGKLETPMPLEIAPLQVGAYVANGSPSLTATTPQEGNGGFTVATNGMPFAYYALSSPVTISQSSGNTASTPFLFTENNPALTSSVAQGSVSGSISGTGGVYDKGQLVFVRFGNIVNTTDISSIVASGSGTFQVNLPAGTASNAVPGAYYYAYLRLWKSGSPKASIKTVPFNGYADLRSSASVSGFNVSF